MCTAACRVYTCTSVFIICCPVSGVSQDGLDRLADIYAIERSKADAKTWAALPAEERQRKEDFYRGQQRAARGFLRMGVVNLKWLNALTGGWVAREWGTNKVQLRVCVSCASCRKISGSAAHAPLGREQSPSTMNGIILVCTPPCPGAPPPAADPAIAAAFLVEPLQGRTAFLLVSCLELLLGDACKRLQVGWRTCISGCVVAVAGEEPLGKALCNEGPRRSRGCCCNPCSVLSAKQVVR